MGGLINGRTVEAIKDKILWCCSAMCCGECKYDANGDFCSSDTVLKDALDLIERIESERDAALAKVPKWISVKERLPEAFVSVLVQMPGEEPHPTVREGYISNEGVWVAGYFRREPDEVTHWAEMPEPPKEGK